MSLPNDAREWWSFLSLIAVRIFVDLKALNESVMREIHPLPKVDETLAQFAALPG